MSAMPLSFVATSIGTNLLTSSDDSTAVYLLLAATKASAMPMPFTTVVSTSVDNDHGRRQDFHYGVAVIGVLSLMVNLLTVWG